jgi:hypothetical protein
MHVMDEYADYTNEALEALWKQEFEFDAMEAELTLTLEPASAPHSTSSTSNAAPENQVSIRYSPAIMRALHWSVSGSAGSANARGRGGHGRGAEAGGRVFLCPWGRWLAWHCACLVQ